MNLAIRGMGWVTPLGNDLETTWEQLRAGKTAQAVPVPSPVPLEDAFYVPIDLKQFNALGRTPRIRRSSAISYFSVVAGLEAMKQAGLEKLTPEQAEKTAVIFAICSGGVHYTRRFYEKVVAEGAQSASPLLFPETVYNAPASHLSALLGIDGESYTVVGDGSVGLAALRFAEELLATNPHLEQCVLVGAEECDWILWEGYATWRLVSKKPCLEVHSRKGLLLAEGGAALVVGRKEATPGGVQVRAAVHSYSGKKNGSAGLARGVQEVGFTDCDWVVASGNGTWIDAVEKETLCQFVGETPLYYPKAALGESLGASVFTQIILGALALQKGERLEGNGGPLRKVGVSILGLNQQAGAALLVKE